jgi:uncharacterized protein (TIGR02145 family)
MKKLIVTLANLLIITSILAQSPQKMSYQAVIRDASDNLVTNTSVGMQISILQESVYGASVYIETQTPTTNANGLVSIEIGEGSIIYGTFSSIDWGNNIYFIKTETDPTGGTTYTITGTSQLLSVPYALHANTVDSYIETDPVFVAHPANGITGTNITNWNTAYGWGNHTGLYRPIDYVPHWNEITTNPFSFVSLANNQLLKYNTTSEKWENWTSNFLTSFTETDPTVQAITGIVKSDGATISAAVAADFPTLNQNTTGNAATATTAATVTTAAQPAITSVGTLTGLTVSGTTTVITPVNATDAVNKAYVDELFEQLYAQGAIRVKDYDGNYYNTIKIGNQIWMAENLKTTKYNDGTPIPNIINNTAWEALTTGAYCDYNNTPSNSTTYGRLYNWYVVDNNEATKMESNGGKNVCPTGWHVPSNVEWTVLTDYLTNNGYGYEGSGSDIGKSMAATSGWIAYGIEGTIGNDQASNNSSGFTALPSGYRDYAGTYHNIGGYEYLWSSSEHPTTNVYSRGMLYTSSDVGITILNKRYGFSVRCLRD